MKIIFAGTPKFALPALKAIFESKKHEICLILTQPDRPAGRGLKVMESPVKELATQLTLPIYQPLSLKEKDVQDKLKSHKADIFIDVAFGLLVPKEILNMPRFGCVNIHPSLLPRWRGASPIQSAILNGDKITGVTIMEMDEGLDTGKILKQESFEIADDDNSETLEPRLANLGAELLLKVLDELQTGIIKKITQNNALTTYAPKITKEEAKINWEKTALEIDRMIRAFNPWPIAFTEINGETVRIFKAQLVNNIISKETAGTIIASSKNGIDVAAHDGVLRILEIQLPGKRVLPVSEVLKSKSDLFAIGKIFSDEI